MIGQKRGVGQSAFFVVFAQLKKMPKHWGGGNGSIPLCLVGWFIVPLGDFIPRRRLACGGGCLIIAGQITQIQPTTQRTF